MAKPRIAFYVPRLQAKPVYVNENYNVRANAGAMVIRDVLERAGFEVGWASAATVDRYDIILVSFIAPCDWWPFIRERATWPKGQYKVIAGGAEVLNVRPFLRFCDYFVLGRGEDVIVPLVDAILSGNDPGLSSVVSSRDFAMDKIYEIKQAIRPYPHEITLTNKRRWREGHIGCPRKCLFCLYSWTRKYTQADGHVYSDQGAQLSKNWLEKTFFDLDLDDPSSWRKRGNWLVLGVDGMSERLRRGVNKPISNEMLRAFLERLPLAERGSTRWYMILGFPSETEDDWRDLANVLRSIRPHDHPQDCGVQLRCTPFNAPPSTPVATWPMAMEDYRNTAERLRKLIGQQFDNLATVFYRRPIFFSVEPSIESLATTIMIAIAHRATEDDTDAIERIARAPAFWNANSPRRVATLKAHFDVDKLMGEYSWGDLPTRNLRTYVSQETLQRLSDWRQRLGVKGMPGDADVLGEG